MTHQARFSTCGSATRHDSIPALQEEAGWVPAFRADLRQAKSRTGLCWRPQSGRSRLYCEHKVTCMMALRRTIPWHQSCCKAASGWQLEGAWFDVNVSSTSVLQVFACIVCMLQLPCFACAPKGSCCPMSPRWTCSAEWGCRLLARTGYTSPLCILKCAASSDNHKQHIIISREAILKVRPHQHGAPSCKTSICYSIAWSQQWSGTMLRKVNILNPMCNDTTT